MAGVGGNVGADIRVTHVAAIAVAEFGLADEVFVGDAKLMIRKLRASIAISKHHSISFCCVRQLSVNIC